MIPDYHMHSRLCKHARGEPGDYLKQAAALGIGQICITDHAPAPDGYDPGNRMDITDFDTYRSWVRDLSDANVEILCGIEADYYPGCETFLRPWLTEQSFDLVLGSIHYIRNWGFDNPDERPKWNSVDLTDTWQEYFSLVDGLVETGLFDVIGHLDLPKKFGHRLPDEPLREMAAPCLDKIAERQMAIEINTSGLRKPVGEIYPCETLLIMAAERSIPICFGSDAHAPEHVGYAFDQAIDLARRSGHTRSIRLRDGEKVLVPLEE